MRIPASTRYILLAVMLVYSNLAFANHMVVHFGGLAGTCTWCVCPGQTPAGPVPDLQPILLQAIAVVAPSTVSTVSPPSPDSQPYQTRAPPTHF